MRLASWIVVGTLAIGALVERDAVANALLSCCGNYGVGNPTRTFYWSTVSFGTGSQWTTQMSRAAGSWTVLDESAITLSIQQDTNGTVGFDNGQNEVWFSHANISNQLGTGAIAYTFNTWETAIGDGKCSEATGCTAPGCEGDGCIPDPIFESDIILYQHESDGTLVPWETATPDGSTSANTAQFFVQGVMTHEFGHAIGLAHVLDGMERMSPAPNVGGWFNSNAHSQPPLGDDRASAHQAYPATTSYSDFYVSNMCNIGGISWALSYEANPGPQQVWPDNNTTPVLGDHDAKRGNAVNWQICYGNLGPAATATTTITATLSLSPTALGPNAFGTFVIPPLAGYARSCQIVQSTVPSTVATNTDYYIVYGVGTGTEQIARNDVLLHIDPDF